jgi:hypothetical protein
LPDELHAWLKKRAALERRSLNTQVLICVEEYRRAAIRRRYILETGASTLSDVPSAAARAEDDTSHDVEHAEELAAR